jgi:hypothetical protein
MLRTRHIILRRVLYHKWDARYSKTDRRHLRSVYTVAAAACGRIGLAAVGLGWGRSRVPRDAGPESGRAPRDTRGLLACKAVLPGSLDGLQEWRYNGHTVGLSMSVNAAFRLLVEIADRSTGKVAAHQGD